MSMETTALTNSLLKGTMTDTLCLRAMYSGSSAPSFDLNDFVSTGVWRFDQVPSISHSPKDLKTGVLEVIVASQTVIQRFYSPTYVTYQRMKWWGPSWSAWTQITMTPV